MHFISGALVSLREKKTFDEQFDHSPQEPVFGHLLSFFIFKQDLIPVERPTTTKQNRTSASIL